MGSGKGSMSRGNENDYLFQIACLRPLGGDHIEGLSCYFSPPVIKEIESYFIPVSGIDLADQAPHCYGRSPFIRSFFGGISCIYVKTIFCAYKTHTLLSTGFVDEVIPPPARLSRFQVKFDVSLEIEF